MMVIGDDHLDHEQFAVRRDGGAAVVQNAHRLRVRPIMQNELEHVDVPMGGHRLKEISSAGLRP